MFASGCAILSAPGTSWTEKCNAETFEILHQMNSNPSFGSTCSAASRGGIEPYVSQVGLLIEKYGLDLLLANLSPRRAARAGLLTSGTSGPSSTTTSASAALQSSLASRLADRLASPGSILFVMTWKPKATPSGRPICRLRASAPRTSDSGCSSWPAVSWATPASREAGGTAERFLERKRQDGRMGVSLTSLALQASWVSPQASDGHGSGKNQHTSSLDKQIKYLFGWPTAARDWKSSASNKHGDNARPLNEVARLSSWATPRVTANGNHGSPKRATDGRARLEDQVHGAISNGSPAGTASTGQLNPAFSLWLMGYPTEWLSCAPSETPSSLKSRPSS